MVLFVGVKKWGLTANVERNIIFTSRLSCVVYVLVSKFQDCVIKSFSRDEPYKNYFPYKISVNACSSIISVLQFEELGIVTSIESNHKNVPSARKGMEVCIKIDPIPGIAPKMFGRHFDETDILCSKVVLRPISNNLPI